MVTVTLFLCLSMGILGLDTTEAYHSLSLFTMFEPCYNTVISRQSRKGTKPMKRIAWLLALVAVALPLAASTVVPRFSTSGGSLVKNDLIVYGDALPNGDVPFLLLAVVSQDDEGLPSVVFQLGCIREDGSECLDPASVPRLRLIDGGQPADEHPKWPRR